MAASTANGLIVRYPLAEYRALYPAAAKDFINFHQAAIAQALTAPVCKQPGAKFGRNLDKIVAAAVGDDPSAYRALPAYSFQLSGRHIAGTSLS
tara:strand:+ start:9401 stop:9682 length:282 start_codon:yes stop_codon:yes gene_type:complete